MFVCVMMIISKDLAKSHARGTLPPASVLSSPAYFLYSPKYLVLHTEGRITSDIRMQNKQI